MGVLPRRYPRADATSTRAAANARYAAPPMATSSLPATRCCAPPTRLSFAADALEAFLSRARASADEVGAMLLGRDEGECVHVVALRPLDNVAIAPRDRFEACPLAFARALREAESDGLRLLGFAHSHPRGEASPSAEDRDAAWTDAAVVIAAPAASRGARIRAFWRLGDGLREIAIEGARGGRS